MKTQIFTRAIFVLSLIFALSDVYSATYYVNDAAIIGDVWCLNVGNNTTGDGSIAKPYLTLTKALSVAGANDIIYVDAGTYLGDNYILKSKISIIGAGPMVTTFKYDNSISGGLHPFAIINGLNNITIQDCRFLNFLYTTDKTSGAEGPQGYGETFTIMNSNSINLTNVYFGKSYGNYGDAAVCIGDNSQDINIKGTSSTCQSSEATFNGSGFMIQSKDHTDGVAKNVKVTFDGCLIGENNKSNQAINSPIGGGIVIQGDITVLVEIKNCSFKNNAAIKGASLYIEGGVVNISNSCFESNVCDDDNHLVAGGAIYWNSTSSKSTISNCTFTSNLVKSVNDKARGGAIFFAGKDYYYTSSSKQLNSFCDVEISDCKFDKNVAKEGKDIYSNVSSNNIIIKNTNFTNLANYSIFNSAGKFNLTSCDNPNPTYSGSAANLTKDNVPTVGTPSTKCVIVNPNGTCAKGNYVACTSVDVSDVTLTCPSSGASASGVITVKAPLSGVYYLYDNLIDANNHLSTFKWKDTASVSSPDLNVSVSATTIYYVIASSDGCAIPTPVTVTYNCPACTTTPTFTTSSTTACPQATVKYATQPGKTAYVWSIPGKSGTDYTIINGGTTTSDTLIIKWLTKGSKTVTVGYTDNSCASTSPATVTTTVSDLSSASFTIQPSANSCQNTSIKYAANNTNSNFKWQITGILGTDYEIVAGGKTTDDTLIVKWKTLGNHIVELDYTASGGCATTTAAKNTTNVVANPAAPTFANSDVKQPICTDPTGSVKFSALPTGNWTIISVPASTNSPVNANGATYTFTGLVKNTSYKFVVKDANACSSDSTSVVTMNDVPNQPEISGVSSLCKDSTLTLRAWVKGKVNQTQSTPNAANPWVSSDLLVATATKTVANSADALVVGKSGGSVKITYTDDANCKQEVTIQVAPKAQSGVASIDKDTICKTNTAAVSLLNYTLTASIQWQDSTAGVWNDIPTEKLPTLNTSSALAPGDYYYRAVVKNGFCNQYDTSNVVKLVVIGLPAPTFVDTIQPSCTVATGGVTSNMQYKGNWTIKATDATGATKDTTATVLINPFSLTIKGLKQGTYTFQVSNSKGCLSNASASIVINPQPTIPAQPALDASVIYCASNSYTLDKIVFNPKPNPLASESIKYFDKNGVVITNPSLVTVKPNEKYRFIFNNGACDSKDTLKLHIPMDKGPTLASNGTNLSLTAICAVEKPSFNTLFAKLPGIDTSLYSFFITPDTIIKPINYLPNKTIIGSNGGNLQEFYYTLADKVNGCKNTVFAKLSFKLDEGPKNLNIKPSQLFCGFSNPTVAKLDTAATKAKTTNTFVWYLSPTSMSPLPSNTPLISGTYYGAEKENPGCESVERKPVLVSIESFGPTTVDPNNVYAFCKGSNKKVSDLPISPYSTTNFVWLDSYKKEIANPKNTALIPGIYYAAEFKNGCISDKSQKIEVQFESPIISITPSKLPTCGVGNGALTIIGADNNLTYQWFKNNDTLVDSTKSYITNLPFDYTIEYKVIAKDKNGCIDSAKTKFSDCEPPGIPHVITLNKDGKNDVFKLHYETKYPNCKLSIFNRWGAMVYESKEKPYKDDWDGKSNVTGSLGSGELPTGTYFYLIDKGDGSALESGYVELVK